MQKAVRYLLTIYSALLLLGVAAFLVVTTVLNPIGAPWYYLAAFYVSVFVAMIGLSGMVGVIFRYRFGSQVELFRSNIITLRQSIWFGLIVISALFLQSQRLLNPYTMILSVAFFAILELFFIRRE